MQARPGESVENFVARPRSQGAIGGHDGDEILAFNRFLKAIATWPKDKEGKRMVPVEWHPYVKGEGPAPP